MAEFALILLDWFLIAAGCAVGFGVVARSMAQEEKEREEDECF
jgi:hypothetical protein